MNRIIVLPVQEGLSVPKFGKAFEAHMAQKRHAPSRDASLTAWNAIAREIGNVLPEVQFETNGKPIFSDGGMCFSLSHSCKLVAIMMSDRPCGVDIELIREDAAKRLYDRCLLPSEKGMDFFEAWTLKECIGKLTGEGIRPLKTDTTARPELGRVSKRIEYEGERYRLSGVWEGAQIDTHISINGAREI